MEDLESREKALRHDIAEFERMRPSDWQKEGLQELKDALKVILAEAERRSGDSPDS